MCSLLRFFPPDWLMERWRESPFPSLLFSINVPADAAGGAEDEEEEARWGTFQMESHSPFQFISKSSFLVTTVWNGDDLNTAVVKFEVLMLSDISFCWLIVRMNSPHTAAVVPTVHPHYSRFGLAFLNHIFSETCRKKNVYVNKETITVFFFLEPALTSAVFLLKSHHSLARN